MINLVKKIVLGGIVAFGITVPGVASAVPYDMNINGAGLSLSFVDLRIGSDDLDYYKGTTTANGTLTVDILFSDAAADLDLLLYNGAQGLVDSSVSVSDNEHVSGIFSAGDMFFIRVNIFGALPNSDTDQFDPNESFSTASVLTTTVPEPGTLALFGLGLAGFGFARRRKAA